MQIGLIIPQLFYDCIARIVPGTILLTTAVVIWGRGIVEKVEITDKLGGFFLINERRDHLDKLFVRAIYNHWILLQFKTIPETNKSQQEEHDSETKENAV